EDAAVPVAMEDIESEFRKELPQPEEIIEPSSRFKVTSLKPTVDTSLDLRHISEVRQMETEMAQQSSSEDNLEKERLKQEGELAKKAQEEEMKRQKVEEKLQKEKAQEEGKKRKLEEKLERERAQDELKRVKLEEKAM